MAAKVALAALITLGLMLVGTATAHVVLADVVLTDVVLTDGMLTDGMLADVVPAELTASAAANRSVPAECSAVGAHCEGAERRGHVAWNAASWLVGLALVVAVGRRGVQHGQD